MTKPIGNALLMVDLICKRWYEDAKHNFNYGLMQSQGPGTCIQTSASWDTRRCKTIRGDQSRSDETQASYPPSQNLVTHFKQLQQQQLHISHAQSSKW